MEPYRMKRQRLHQLFFKFHAYAQGAINTFVPPTSTTQPRLNQVSTPRLHHHPHNTFKCSSSSATAAACRVLASTAGPAPSDTFCPPPPPRHHLYPGANPSPPSPPTPDEELPHLHLSPSREHPHLHLLPWARSAPPPPPPPGEEPPPPPPPPARSAPASTPPWPRSATTSPPPPGRGEAPRPPSPLARRPPLHLLQVLVRALHHLPPSRCSPGPSTTHPSRCTDRCSTSTPLQVHGQGAPLTASSGSRPGVPLLTSQVHGQGFHLPQPHLEVVGEHPHPSAPGGRLCGPSSAPPPLWACTKVAPAPPKRPEYRHYIVTMGCCVTQIDIEASAWVK
ncbi:hypothetical protein HU200_054884 [Digitaria exilis]|uniref:Uncharacterized protein n=1 Tax=Digitaria exilis TaxID=1010633 RepID=A0A835E6I9_9POAL|nr:hypothetical protein HU200_054884 [Digitaria exilis]